MKHWIPVLTWQLSVSFTLNQSSLFCVNNQMLMYKLREILGFGGRDGFDKRLIRELCDPGLV